MLIAAFEDLRRLVIPNPVVLGLCVLWPLQLASAPVVSLAAAGGAALCAAAVFAGGAILFSRGLMGGGDVKLLAAATLWAGSGSTPALLKPPTTSTLSPTRIAEWEARPLDIGVADFQVFVDGS